VISSVDDVMSWSSSTVVVTSTENIVVSSIVFDVAIKSIEDVDACLVINSVVDAESVVISDGIIETTVLISLAIVVTIGELVSIANTVLNVVVIVVIFCVEIPRDVNIFDERLVGRFE
jgi:hypothetical protein